MGFLACKFRWQRELYTWTLTLAPKLFGTEKLLPCHRPRMRRSSFPNYQRVGMLTCSKVTRFQPRLERRGTDCQCWHTFPSCGKRQALLQHLPRGRTHWRRIQPIIIIIINEAGGNIFGLSVHLCVRAAPGQKHSPTSLPTTSSFLSVSAALLP